MLFRSRYVHTDLVGAAGFQRDAQQGRGVAKAFFDAVMGNGGFAIGANRHFQAVAWVAAEWLVDGVTSGHVAVDEGEVSAAHRALLQLADEMGVRAQVAGDDEQAAGVFIQAVNDAAARQLRGFREMMQEGV